MENKNSHNLANFVLEKIKKNNKIIFSYRRVGGEYENLTALDIEKRITYIIKILNEYGVEAGDRILLLAPTSPQYLICFLAALKINVVPVLFDYKAESKQINTIIDSTSCKIIFTTYEVEKKVNFKLKNHLPIFSIENGVILINSYVKKNDNIFKICTMDEEIAFIMFSSGTTNRIKGVQHTHDSQIFALSEGVTSLDIQDGNCDFLAILPLSHIAGLTAVLSALYYRGTVYMIENVDSLKMMTVLQEREIKYIVLIPKIYDEIKNRIEKKIEDKGKIVSKIIFGILTFSLVCKEKWDINIGIKLFKKIRTAIFGAKMTHLLSGGTKLNSKTKDFFISLGYEFIDVYATTETSVPILVSKDKKYLSNITGIVAHPQISIQIINEKDGVGELVVKTPGLFKSYFNDEEATRLSFTQEGFFRTGDLAEISSHGYVKIVGRCKESIILKNGEKVSPEDVETMYSELETIKDLDFAVAGVQYSDEEPWDTMVLFIAGELSNIKKMDIKQKILFEIGKIPDNYRTNEVIFVEEIPRTSIGKVKRYELKEYAFFSKIEHKKDERSFNHIVDSNDLHGRINKCIRENSSMELNTVCIREEMNLCNELGYDSLSLFQLASALEEQFKCDYSQFFSADMKVVDLYNIIEEQEYIGVNVEYKYNLDEYPLKKSKLDILIIMFLEGILKKIYSIEIIGKENLPYDKAYILCPNHISEYDPFFVLMAFSNCEKQDINCISWDKFTKSRKTRYFLKLVNGIPIDRRSVGNSSQTLIRCKKLLGAGKKLIIFPEGTRTYDGKLGRFQLGAGMLARDCNVPIIPVTLVGMYDAFSKNNKGVKFFKGGKRIKIKLILGEPVWYDKSIEATTKCVKMRIYNSLDSLH